MTLTEIVALANALEIAPSELTTLPVPAPATDAPTQPSRQYDWPWTRSTPTAWTGWCCPWQFCATR
ncbi:MAG: hypothetical protein ACRDRQ_12430 [Pseudonocardiaceae bacterium]